MFKKALIIVLLGSILLLSTPLSLMAQDIKVIIDDNEITFDVPPKNVNNRILVPFRKIFESLGLNVSWNPERNTITGNNENTTVSFTIDNKVACLNGSQVDLAVAPIILNSRALVPIRFISESIGKEVSWDSDNKVITIKTNEGYPNNNSKILTFQQMKDDLDFVVTALRNIHPVTKNGFTEVQNTIIQAAYDRIKKQLSLWEFYFIVNDIVISFKDAHTSLQPIASNIDWLDIPIVWLNDGIYITKDTENFSKGDKIISISDNNEEQLLNKLAKYISYENKYHLKLIGSRVLVNGTYLRKLGLIRENPYVFIDVEREGKIAKVKMTLSKTLKDGLIVYPEKWVSWEINKEDSVGIFNLHQCNYGNEFLTNLDDFFTEVSKNNIRNIAIDLRKNWGGSSQVIDEFMKYIDIEEYYDFSVLVRFSQEAKNQRNYLQTIGFVSYDHPRTETVNGKKVRILKRNSTYPVFNGNIYVLTSNETFSSANQFVAILQDNKLAKIIGESTGNSPSCYGDIFFYTLPNSGIRFNVSHKQFFRPIQENDPSDAIYPDIPVYTTGQSVKNGQDLQIYKLKELLQ